MANFLRRYSKILPYSVVKEGGRMSSSEEKTEHPEVLYITGSSLSNDDAKVYRNFISKDTDLRGLLYRYSSGHNAIILISIFIAICSAVKAGILAVSERTLLLDGIMIVIVLIYIVIPTILRYVILATCLLLGLTFTGWEVMQKENNECLNLMITILGPPIAIHFLTNKLIREWKNFNNVIQMPQMNNNEYYNILSAAPSDQQAVGRALLELQIKNIKAKNIAVNAPYYEGVFINRITLSIISIKQSLKEKNKKSENKGRILEAWWKLTKVLRVENIFAYSAIYEEYSKKICGEPKNNVEVGLDKQQEFKSNVGFGVLFFSYFMKSLEKRLNNQIIKIVVKEYSEKIKGEAEHPDEEEKQRERARLCFRATTEFIKMAVTPDRLALTKETCTEKEKDKYITCELKKIEYINSNGNQEEIIVDQGALNYYKHASTSSIFSKVKNFLVNRYVPDILIMFYKRWTYIINPWKNDEIVIPVKKIIHIPDANITDIEQQKQFAGILPLAVNCQAKKSLVFCVGGAEHNNAITSLINAHHYNNQKNPVKTCVGFAENQWHRMKNAENHYAFHLVGNENNVYYVDDRKKGRDSRIQIDKYEAIIPIFSIREEEKEIIVISVIGLSGFMSKIALIYLTDILVTSKGEIDMDCLGKKQQIILRMNDGERALKKWDQCDFLNNEQGFFVDGTGRKQRLDRKTFFAEYIEKEVKFFE